MSAAQHRGAAPPRAALPLGLLALTVLLGGALAYEAQREIRSHRESAERALRDYATGQARTALAHTAAGLGEPIARALAPVTEAAVASPYDLLPPPHLIAAQGREVLRCDEPRDAGGRFYFRLDLRDNTLVTSGAPVGDERRWLTPAVAEHARSQYRPGARFAAIVAPPAAARRLVVYGVKYAPHQAPVAAYGFVTCPVALERAVLAGWRRAATDSLLALAAVTQDGRDLFRSASWDDGAPARQVASQEIGGVVLRAALTRPAAERIVVQPATRPGLPLLLGFLTLTAALAAVALAQLRREQELARLRADFTSSVSHELRTPLAQILLFGETLALDRVRSSEERRAAAETIVQEARRLLGLVENVLHFAQAERGAIQLEPRTVQLAPLLDSVVAAFAPLADAARARLVTALDADAAAVADPLAVRQIVLNLLDNAVKYGPQGETVLLGAAQSGAWARVWVEDGGRGVPEPDRERIWWPFVRLVRDRNAYETGGQARTGSGIGLAVVRELTTRMGGRAWVEPGARGGARFVVELPAASSDPPAVGPRPGSMAERRALAAERPSPRADSREPISP